MVSGTLTLWPLLPWLHRCACVGLWPPEARGVPWRRHPGRFLASLHWPPPLQVSFPPPLSVTSASFSNTQLQQRLPTATLVTPPGRVILFVSPLLLL